VEPVQQVGQGLAVQQEQEQEALLMLEQQVLRLEAFHPQQVEVHLEAFGLHLQEQVQQSSLEQVGEP
jgi:hypothetical protein